MDVLTLVPWADMLNHSSEAGPESCLRFDRGARCASLCAHRGYGCGEEVFDSYGHGRTAGEVLLDYGFADARNRNHAVNLRVSLGTKGLWEGSDGVTFWSLCLWDCGSEGGDVFLDRRPCWGQ